MSLRPFPRRRLSFFDEPLVRLSRIHAVGNGPALTLTLSPRSTPPAADAGCSTKELEAFASSTRAIPVFDLSFITNDLQKEFLRRGRALAQCGKILTLRLQSPLLCLSFRRHTTTKLGRITKAWANVSPSPEGEGGVRGKGLACRLRLSFQALAPVSIPPKIARNQLEYPLWMMRMPQVPL